MTTSNFIVFRNSVAALLCCLIILAGCGTGLDPTKEEQQVDAAIQQIRTTNGKLQDVVNILQKLQGDINDGKIKNQVEEITNNLAGATQVTGTALTDFWRARLIESLQDVKADLTGKALPERIPQFTQANVRDIRLDDLAQTTVSIVGWNIRPSKYLRVTILNQKGEERPVDDLQVTFQGQYALSINVNRTSGVPFKNDDKQLVVKWKDLSAFSIGIVPPPPPAVVTSAWVTIRTTEDNKDHDTEFEIHLKRNDGQTISYQHIQEDVTYNDSPPEEKTIQCDINKVKDTTIDQVKSGIVTIKTKNNGGGGDDEWGVTPKVALHFSDGSEYESDWSGYQKTKTENHNWSGDYNFAYRLNKK